MAKLTEGIGGGGGHALVPGEIRTVAAKDSSGNVLKHIEIVRTEREYVYDLCDAYNAARTNDARERGQEWFVTPSGELRLGDSSAWSKRNAKRIESRRETERARYNRHYLENCNRTAEEREAENV